MRRLAGPLVALLFVIAFLLWAIFWAPELLFLAARRRSPLTPDEKVGW